MKHKFSNGFFGIVSWGVWAVMIFLIFFSVVLLFTGMYKAPVFTLNSAEIIKAPADDEILLQNGKSGEDWYILRLDMEVSASKLSPFTYTATGFELKAPKDLKAACDNFAFLDDSLTYSKASPDSFVLTLYINCPASEQTLLDRASEIGFGIRGLEGHLGFIKNTIDFNMPGFYLSDFPDISVSFNEAV